MVRPQMLNFGVGSRWALYATLFSGFGAAAFAGCSSDDRAKPTLGSAGNSAHAGKTSRGGSQAAMNDGGAGASAAAAATAGSDSEGGVSALGGAPPDGVAGSTAGPPGVGGDPGLMLEPCENDGAPEPAAFAGVCTATKGWSAGTKLAVPSGAGPSFVAVSASELTVVWEEAISSAPVYFLADRAATSDAFGEAQELAFTKVLGVSPDGLRLTVASGDGALLEATRGEAGDAFGEAVQGAYSVLDADAIAHHLVLSDVAISPDDRSLFYSAWSLDDSTTYPVRFSTRTGTEPWPASVTVQSCQLKAYGAFGPRPAAVSNDKLTLFYADDARGTARAAFRTTVTADFTWFVDLPGVLRPQPNAACDKLYYSPTTGEPGLLSASRAP